MSGAVSYYAGLTAEGIVARQYRDRGFQIVANRWRGCAGEIDLIVTDGAEYLFVEVKRSESFESAAMQLEPRQMKRIYCAAGEFLGTLPIGQDTDCRFDVALVDGIGDVRILENAFGQF